MYVCFPLTLKYCPVACLPQQLHASYDLDWQFIVSCLSQSRPNNQYAFIFRKLQSQVLEIIDVQCTKHS